jgi:hypothetical protein
MNTFTELTGGVINSVDTFTSDALNNKFAYITIVVLVLLYGSLSASRLTKNSINCLDNPMCRLLFLGFLYYISTKNISLALLILASVVLSMCAIQKQKQNLIIISMMRRKITSHKKRKHQLRLLQRRKALKLKLLLKKLMIIMKKREAARRKHLTPKVNKILNKATQMSKELGHSTPKLVKQIQKNNNVTPKVNSAKVVQTLNDSIIIPSESIQRLINMKAITQNDAIELSKLTREKLVSFIKKHEYSTIIKNIVPENLIVKIIKRLNKEKNSTKIVKSPVVVTTSPVTTPISVTIPSSPSSPSSISSPSSGSNSPMITITDTKSASTNSVSSVSKGPTIVFPKKK